MAVFPLLFEATKTSTLGASRFNLVGVAALGGAEDSASDINDEDDTDCCLFRRGKMSTVSCTNRVLTTGIGKFKGKNSTRRRQGRRTDHLSTEEEISAITDDKPSKSSRTQTTALSGGVTSGTSRSDDPEVVARGMLSRLAYPTWGLRSQA